MRPTLHGDISSAARALFGVPEAHRRRLCRRIIREAELADRFVSRTGKPHPVFGTGSLMSAARKRVLLAEPGFDNIDFCRCFEIVLQELISFHLSQKRS